ncbi:MAG: hypothetical protein ACLGPL_11435 [Acidobacteriota bacterium]
MRYFSLIDLQYMFLVVFFGLISSALVYIAWGMYPSGRHEVSEEQIEKQEGHEIPHGHKPKGNPIAPFLIISYVGVVLWGLGYAVYMIMRKGPIW